MVSRHQWVIAALRCNSSKMKTYLTFDRRALRMDARACGASYVRPAVPGWQSDIVQQVTNTMTLTHLTRCPNVFLMHSQTVGLLKWRQTPCNTAEPRRRKPKRWKAGGGVSAHCPFPFLLHSLPLRLGEVYPW